MISIDFKNSSNSCLGEGVYGMVMESVNTETGEKVAVKINVTDSCILGIGTLREADILSRTAGHPYIVDFRGILFGTPEFRETPAVLKSPRVKADQIHFVMGLESGNLGSLIRSRKPMTFRNSKIVFAQILLGIEWIHGHGVAHLDIKPENILLSSKPESKFPHIRLCDFGLSCVLGGPNTHTPGAVTSWYRPPEICLGRRYSENADVWSVALVAFELISRRALLYGTRDENNLLLESIFRRLPDIASISTINTVNGGKISRRTIESITLTPEAKKSIMDESISSAERRASVASHLRSNLRLSARDVQNFADETEGRGTISEFCDLLAWMLSFDPEKRPSATDALKHPFFDWLRDFIDETQQKYPPSGAELPIIAIHPCRERTIAIHLILSLYNASFTEDGPDWYNHRLALNAIDLFDRYIAFMFENNGEPYTIHHDEDSVYLRMYVCLYMIHKYFKTLEVPDSWDKFVPSRYRDVASRDIATDFEIFILRDVCKYKLYRDTMYEYIAFRDGRASERKIRECIVKLCEIDMPWKVGSVRSLARELNI